MDNYFCFYVGITFYLPLHPILIMITVIVPIYPFCFYDYMHGGSLLYASIYTPIDFIFELLGVN